MAIPLLLLLLLSPAAPAAARKHRHTRPTSEADYVIIGGGTAGCVVAARLCAALPHATITLLERGAPRNETAEALVSAMRLTADTWRNPDITEAFLTAPGPGVAGRTLEALTGNTLGGSSSINAGLWSIPGLEEVESWGFPGLTRETAGKYFTAAAEQVQPAVPPRDLWMTYFADWITAANASGIPTDVPPLVKRPTPVDGVLYSPVAADETGRRRDSCTAYLEPVMHDVCRDNLELVQSALVTKIEVEDGDATGVIYLKKDEPEGRQERHVRARRGVVSSAGPYGSPKLLQLSGIGPAPLLRRLGVPLVHNLPVGRGTQGRVFAPLAELYTAAPLPPEANSSIIFSDATAATFAAGGGGPLGISIGGLTGALLDESCQPGGSLAIDGPAMLFYAVPNARSRGTLSVRDPANPGVPPAVDLNLLTHAAEVPALQRCLRRIRAVNAVLRPDLGLVNIEPGGPGVNASYVRGAAQNAYHFAAGCAVGAVVDGEFRVRGVGGLRVVDASVLPKLPDFAGPMASVYALAEHAAELMIAEDPDRDVGVGGAYGFDEAYGIEEVYMYSSYME